MSADTSAYTHHQHSVSLSLWLWTSFPLKRNVYVTYTRDSAFEWAEIKYLNEMNGNNITIIHLKGTSEPTSEHEHCNWPTTSAQQPALNVNSFQFYELWGSEWANELHMLSVQVRRWKNRLKKSGKYNHHYNLMNIIYRRHVYGLSFHF